MKRNLWLLVSFISLSLIIQFLINIPLSTAAEINVPDEYSSIQAAIDVANNGDVIIIQDGIYTENLLITKNGIKLIGQGVNTIIDGDDYGTVVYVRDVTTFSIENCTIRNGGKGQTIPGNGGIHIDGARPSEYFDECSFIIRNCRVEFNGKGISIWNLWKGLALIQNCIIVNNSFTGISTYTGPITIDHCTIVNNGTYGIYEMATEEYQLHTIKNSIICFNGRPGVYIPNDIPKYISYNNNYGNEFGAYYQGLTGPSYLFNPSPGTGEISSDPLFVGGDPFDYHLTEYSPCIDAGANLGAPSVDIDGISRPQDGDGDGIALCDMGAYESPQIYIYYQDYDEDGFGDPNNTIKAYSCPQGYVENSSDCDDNDTSTCPGAQEICDGKDNNCDGIVPNDEIDSDKDGFRMCEGDCDDSDNTIYPGAPGKHEEKDNNCNGVIDWDEKKRTYQGPLYQSYMPLLFPWQQSFQLIGLNYPQPVTALGSSMPFPMIQQFPWQTGYRPYMYSIGISQNIFQYDRFTFPFNQPYWHQPFLQWYFVNY